MKEHTLTEDCWCHPIRDTKEPSVVIHSPYGETVSSEIDTGDTVKHGPTGEEWVVAYVQGDKLAWCGWPFGLAKLSDCTLTEKASPQERLKLLRELARCRTNADPRCVRARDILSAQRTGGE